MRKGIWIGCSETSVEKEKNEVLKQQRKENGICNRLKSVTIETH